MKKIFKEFLKSKKVAKPKELSFAEAAKTITSSMYKVLVEKNKRYGNSALDPLEGIKYTPEDGIKIRLTDKVKRIINSDNLRKNDIFDVIGYLILLSVAKGWYDFSDQID